MDSELYEDEDIDLAVDDEIEVVEPETEEPEVEVAEEEDNYSKNVQKRISKVVQQRNIERDKRTQVEQENAVLRERLAQFDAGNKETELAALRKQKIEALEVGDYEAYADIDDKLADVKAKQVYQAPQAEQPEPEPISNELIAWQEKNKWIFDANNPKTQKANEIYYALLDEGFDKDDPELYKTVDRKLKREVPPSPGLPDRGQVSAAASGTFTAQDRTLMAEFGLDPSNKAHRIQWAKSKKAVNNG